MSYVNFLNYTSQNFSLSTGNNSGFVSSSTITLVSSGRPVNVIFGAQQGVNSNTGVISYITPSSGSGNNVTFGIARYVTGTTPNNSNIIYSFQFGNTIVGTQTYNPNWFFNFIDTTAPGGSNSYVFFITNNSNSTISMSGVCLSAYEI